jgi:hypothetical protein
VIQQYLYIYIYPPHLYIFLYPRRIFLIHGLARAIELAYYVGLIGCNSGCFASGPALLRRKEGFVPSPCACVVLVCVRRRREDEEWRRDSTVRGGICIQCNAKRDGNPESATSAEYRESSPWM